MRIDGKILPPGDWFGGPLLVQGAETVFLPRFNLRRRRFELCRIDLITREVHVLTPPRPLIWLHQLEADQLYFYEDLERRELTRLDLATGELHAAKKADGGEMNAVLLNPFFVIAVTILTAAGIAIILLILG